MQQAEQTPKRRPRRGPVSRISQFAHKRAAVEREFGEPFEEVIKGFARDGESMSATGAILGYSPSAFTELLRREGLVHLFVNRKERSAHKQLQQALTEIQQLREERDSWRRVAERLEGEKNERGAEQ